MLSFWRRSSTFWDLVGLAEGSEVSEVRLGNHHYVRVSCGLLVVVTASGQPYREERDIDDGEEAHVEPSHEVADIVSNLA